MKYLIRILYCSLFLTGWMIQVHAQQSIPAVDLAYEGSVSKKESMNINTGFKTIKTDRLKQGRNLIGKNKQTGNKLYVRIDRNTRNRLNVRLGHKKSVKVIGFTANEQPTAVFYKALPSKDRPKINFSCPKGKKDSYSCYFHPISKQVVCYTLCTTGQLKFKLPSKW